MKIKDILAKGLPSVSFEIFPPRSDSPFEPVKEAVERCVLLLGIPCMISEFIIGRNAQANTVEVASFVQKCGVPALAHLTCIAATKDSIDGEVAALRSAGIENVLCLRGDLPKGAEEQSQGPFQHAVDLVRALRPAGFCLGGACYPECHPDCAHMEDDILHLREKVEAGLDFVTTQMFFDNNIFYRYLSKLRDRGVTVPVIAGIMPVTNGKQIATNLPPLGDIPAKPLQGDSRPLRGEAPGHARRRRRLRYGADRRPLRKRHKRRARLHDEQARSRRAHYGEPAKHTVGR